jgi:hypothetical protein
MLSIWEIRRIIECGFQPLSCTCTYNHNGSLVIEVFEDETGRVELVATAVSTANLTSAQSIENLIGELRSEIAFRTTSFL